MPIRCQGTPWITHKRRAMQRIIDRFGVYITHLEAMVNDTSTKPVDRAKLEGYHRKWSQAEIIIGCAMYVDLLKAPSLLSFSLQEDIDIVTGIKNILKSVSSLQSLLSETPKEWPTVKLVLSKILREETVHEYQGAALTHFSDSGLKLF